MFRFSHGAGAGGGGDVDVVYVNVGLAGVPVRGGGHFGDQPGRGHQPVGEPGRDRGGGPGNQGDVQAGLLQGLADAALRGGLVSFHVAACREPAFEAGMPHQGGQPAALAVPAEDEHAGVGSMISCLLSGCAGKLPGRRAGLPQPAERAAQQQDPAAAAQDDVDVDDAGVALGWHGI